MHGSSHFHFFFRFFRREKIPTTNPKPKQVGCRLKFIQLNNMTKELVVLSLFLGLVQIGQGTAAIYCSTGFGQSDIKIEIPPERINDGYCDCPTDGGIDELETGACSGAMDGGWAGIPSEARLV
jgi:hypothetical protein